MRAVQSNHMIAAVAASIPIGIVGAWIWTMHDLEQQQRDDLERKVRIVVQAKLEAGEDNMTAGDVLRDLAAIEKARQSKGKM